MELWTGFNFLTRSFTSIFPERIDSKRLFIVETFKELTCSYIRTEGAIKNTNTIVSTLASCNQVCLLHSRDSGCIKHTTFTKHMYFRTLSFSRIKLKYSFMQVFTLERPWHLSKSTTEEKHVALATCTRILVGAQPCFFP